jgi:hypothetical protein
MVGGNFECKGSWRWSNDDGLRYNPGMPESSGDFQEPASILLFKLIREELPVDSIVMMNKADCNIEGMAGLLMTLNWLEKSLCRLRERHMCQSLVLKEWPSPVSTDTGRCITATIYTISAPGREMGGDGTTSGE